MGMGGQNKGNKKGLVIVNTGNGKGKTTASLGILMRSWGRDLRVCMLGIFAYPPKKVHSRAIQLRGSILKGIIIPVQSHQYQWAEMIW